MKSRGGKRVYRCPDCDSESIEKVRFYGQSSYHCAACNAVGPWRERKKEPGDE